MSEDPAQPARSKSDFAARLRDAISQKGVTLRTLQREMRARGNAVGIATLSLWSTGGRRPSLLRSGSAITELEGLLDLHGGELTDLLKPQRRVTADRNQPYNLLAGYDDLLDADQTRSPRELSERSGSIIVYVNADGRVERTVNRTLYQARIDDAQEVDIFVSLEAGENVPPRLRGTIGCEIIGISANMETMLLRATLRLDSSLAKGEMVLTEHETFDRHYSDGPLDTRFTLSALRRQNEVTLAVVFDAEKVPTRCSATVDNDEDIRAHVMTLNGTCATCVEFNFGPGNLTVDWEW